MYEGNPSWSSRSLLGGRAASTLLRLRPKRSRWCASTTSAWATSSASISSERASAFRCDACRAASARRASATRSRPATTTGSGSSSNGAVGARRRSAGSGGVGELGLGEGVPRRRGPRRCSTKGSAGCTSVTASSSLDRGPRRPVDASSSADSVGDAGRRGDLQRGQHACRAPPDRAGAGRGRSPRCGLDGRRAGRPAPRGRARRGLGRRPPARGRRRRRRPPRAARRARPATRAGCGRTPRWPRRTRGPGRLEPLEQTIPLVAEIGPARGDPMQRRVAARAGHRPAPRASCPPRTSSPSKTDRTQVATGTVELDPAGHAPGDAVGEADERVDEPLAGVGPEPAHHRQARVEVDDRVAVDGHTGQSHVRSITRPGCAAPRPPRRRRRGAAGARRAPPTRARFVTAAAVRGSVTSSSATSSTARAAAIASAAAAWSASMPRLDGVVGGRRPALGVPSPNGSVLIGSTSPPAGRRPARVGRRVAVRRERHPQPAVAQRRGRDRPLAERVGQQQRPAVAHRPGRAARRGGGRARGRRGRRRGGR